ncbi:unnamed protein product [Ilex paraguariensis]|uniref:Uncharacterized protein n=1 Tax=Ilex paraguariensis TaxID=185542 RepID=A0ABC8QYY1_9AQUA
MQEFDGSCTDHSQFSRSWGLILDSGKEIVCLSEFIRHPYPTPPFLRLTIFHVDVGGTGLTPEKITTVYWFSRAEAISFSTMVIAQNLFRFGFGPDPTITLAAALTAPPLLPIRTLLLRVSKKTLPAPQERRGRDPRSLPCMEDALPVVR